MKLRLIANLERARANLLEAIDAIAEEDVERAKVQLELVRGDFDAAADELQAA